jgi:hypothetical protein
MKYPQFSKQKDLDYQFKLEPLSNRDAKAPNVLLPVY